MRVRIPLKILVWNRIAQKVEQRPAKLDVAGSIPAPVSQPGKRKAERSGRQSPEIKAPFFKAQYPKGKEGTDQLGLTSVLKSCAFGSPTLGAVPSRLALGPFFLYLWRERKISAAVNDGGHENGVLWLSGVNRLL